MLDGVGVHELAPRHEVGDARVLGRDPQQRQALDHERQRVDPPQPADERHRRVHRAPRDVGRDHQPLAVHPVDQHPRERPEQDRRQHAGDHHAGHRERRPRAAAAVPLHERGHRDEPHPVPERGHGHRGHELRERGEAEEVLQRRGLGAPEGVDLIGQAGHGSLSSGRWVPGYAEPDPFPSGPAPAGAGSDFSAPAASGIEPTFTSTPSCTIDPHATHFALSRAWAVSRPPQCGQGSGSGIDHTAKSQSGYRLQRVEHLAPAAPLR